MGSKYVLGKKRGGSLYIMGIEFIIIIIVIVSIIISKYPNDT